MIQESSWDEFYKSGLLWWINRSLHLFGWAIVLQVEDDGTISKVYPARCQFRGFDDKTETEGFRKLTNHLVAEQERLLKDVQ